MGDPTNQSRPGSRDPASQSQRKVGGLCLNKNNTDASVLLLLLHATAPPIKSQLCSTAHEDSGQCGGPQRKWAGIRYTPRPFASPSCCTALLGRVVRGWRMIIMASTCS
ncbi:hypothetical protein MHYP_G00115470 [Metynnis hypsauchen]